MRRFISRTYACKAPAALRFSRGRAEKISAADAKAILRIIKGLIDKMESVETHMRKLNRDMNTKTPILKDSMDAERDAEMHAKIDAKNARFEQNVDAKMAKLVQDMRDVYLGWSYERIFFASSWAFGIVWAIAFHLEWYLEDARREQCRLELLASTAEGKAQRILVSREMFGADVTENVRRAAHRE